MNRNLALIILIFAGASLAWFVLGGTLVARSSESDATARDLLDSQWGGEQIQSAPSIASPGKRGAIGVPLRSSKLGATLKLEQRRKGLLWYNLYVVHFSGRYAFKNTTPNPTVCVTFKFPGAGGNFTDFVYTVNGRPIESATIGSTNVVSFPLAPGRDAAITVSYASRGSGMWSYRFGEGVSSARNFSLRLATNFSAVDFPARTLLPTSEVKRGDGWLLEWKYGSIVSGDDIGVTVPYPLQPGPLAERITFWAPVALGFYFFVLVVIAALRNIDLHPVNYFFLACAFFSFHLLFAYLVDRIPIEFAFVICSLVSLFLTISYLRLVAGLRFAAIESGIAQTVYLVLFSYALFNEGWSGLAITIGAILTLFAVMQLTGRIRWSQRASVAPSA